MSETNSNKSIPKSEDITKKDSNNNNSVLNQSIPLVPNQQSIKMEVLQFKDEVLKQLKLLKKSISEKYESNATLISEKLKTYDSKFTLINDRLTELSGKINTDNNIKADVTSLLQFKNKSRDNLLTIDIKMNNIDKELRNNISRIDNILSDSVIYPGIIGKSCKFKNFHHLLDHVLSQISQTITYREKNTLDLNTYKKKLESIVQSLQSQKDGIVEENNKLLNQKMKEIEEKFKSLISLYDERLAETRAENSLYIRNMQETVFKFKNELTEFQDLKGKIFEEIQKEGSILREENEKTQTIFLGYKKEFNLLKDRFTQLSEFIKDVRFRINIGQEVKRREFYQMSNKIDFSKKQKIENNNINHSNIEESESNANQFLESKENQGIFRKESLEIKKNDNKQIGYYSPDAKSKGRNHFIRNKKIRHNTITMGKTKKIFNSKNINNTFRINNSKKLLEKNEQTNNTIFGDSRELNLKEINEESSRDNGDTHFELINVNREDSENDNKNNNEDNINGVDNVSRTIKNDRRRSSIRVRNIMGDLQEVKVDSELNKNKDSSKNIINNIENDTSESGSSEDLNKENENLKENESKEKNINENGNEKSQNKTKKTSENKIIENKDKENLNKEIKNNKNENKINYDNENNKKIHDNNEINTNEINNNEKKNKENIKKIKENENKNNEKEKKENNINKNSIKEIKNNQIEKKEKDNLISLKLSSEKNVIENKKQNINQNSQKKIKLNTNNNANNYNFNEMINIINSNTNLDNNQEKFKKNNSQKNNIQNISDIPIVIKKDNQTSCKTMPKKTFNGISNSKNENVKNVIMQDILSPIQINNKNQYSNSIKEDQKIINNNDPKNNFSTINNNYFNVIESKKNSKIYTPINRENFNRTQSAFNSNLPNLKAKINYNNQKLQTLRPSSSTNNIGENRNLKNKKIIIDSSYKSLNVMSKTIDQNNLLEEDKKINIKVQTKNNINSELYYEPSYAHFKSSKIRTNLSPNVQILQHGVQQIYDNNNQTNNFNLEEIKKSISSNNANSNFNKKRKFIDKNKDAMEIQGMINNLQGYIKDYGTNYMTPNEIKKERKKVSKNSSYYKFKEILNENRKNNNDIVHNKNKGNIVEIGFNSYK